MSLHHYFQYKVTITDFYLVRHLLDNKELLKSLVYDFIILVILQKEFLHFGDKYWNIYA